MDEKMISEIISRVFANDAAGFELALIRLKLQAELVQINSKIAVVNVEAEKNATEYVAVLPELANIRAQKQAEIDALENK